MRTIVPALALAAGCTSASPLVESSPQIELTSNPGGVTGQSALELTLTTWNHLAALGDAVDGHQLAATLDGMPLAIDPAATGYFGNGDRYVAAFTLPSTRVSQMPAASPTSTVAITDQQTTWTFQVANLRTNDVQPQGTIAAGQPAVIAWPSAARDDVSYSTIDWACVEIASRGAACHGTGSDAAGVDITRQFITIDLPANPGDSYRVWGARHVSATASGNGPELLVSVLGQLRGTFD